MKTHLLAAELARLVPELAKDSAVNRETVIRGMLDKALAEAAAQPLPPIYTVTNPAVVIGDDLLMSAMYALSKANSIDRAEFASELNRRMKANETKFKQ